MPFTVKDYVVSKDNKVIRVYETSQGEAGVIASLEHEGIDRTGHDIVEIPTTHKVEVGSDLREYTKDWNKRSLKDRVEEGYVKLRKAEEDSPYPEGTVLEKVSGEELTPKTDYDFVKEGVRELQANEYLDDEAEEIKTGTLQKLLEVGRINQTEYTERLSKEVRQQRDGLLATKIDPIVTNPLRWNDLSKEEQDRIATYRQALLDVPEQKGFPETVEWPEL
jgi:hypothetical protein